MDTASSAKDLSWFLSEFWSTALVALIIYGGGLTAEQIVLALWPQTADLVSGKTKVMDPKLPLAFRLWQVTRIAHPFLVGAGISFIPGLPTPDFVTSHTSGVLWFGAIAGGGNAQIHTLVEALMNQARKLVDLVVPWVRKRLGLPASQSSPPPARERDHVSHDPTPSSDGTALSDRPSDPPPPPEAA